jgi:hypothetical protein
MNEEIAMMILTAALMLPAGFIATKILGFYDDTP